MKALTLYKVYFCKIFLSFFLVVICSLNAFALPEDKCSTVIAQKVDSSKGIMPDKIKFYRQTLAQIKALGRSVNLAETRSTVEERKHFADLLNKALKANEDSLSASELQFINSRPWFQKIFKWTLRFAFPNEFLKVFIKNSFSHWQANESAIHWFKEPTWGGKLKRVLQSTYNGPFRALFPGYLNEWKAPANKIFHQQWDSPANQISHKPWDRLKSIFTSQNKVTPNYEPTAEDIATLEKYGALEKFMSKKEFMSKRPNWSRVRRLIGQTAIAISLVNTVASVNHGMHMYDGKVNSYEQFETAPEYKLASNQIRIYNESVPFPHMAVQIGDKVYSYGQSHMTVQTTYEYLQSNEIRNAQIKYVENNNIEIPTEEPGGSFDILKGKAMETMVGLIPEGALPRSVEMTTLNLSEIGIKKLQRDLELNTAKRYRNHTFVVDCATMIVNALKLSTDVSIPSLIDPSPSLIMIYLSTLKTLGTKNRDGNNIVDNVFITATESPEKVKMHLIRDTYVNAIEGKIFIYLAPFIATHRSYMELRYGSENWQYWDPEVKQEIASWSDIIRTEIENKNEFIFVDILKSKAIEAYQIADVSAKNASEHAINNYFKLLLQPEEQQLQSGNTSFWDVMRSGYKLKYYRNYRDYLLGLLEKPSEEEFNGSEIKFEELLELSKEFI